MYVYFTLHGLALCLTHCIVATHVALSNYMHINNVKICDAFLKYLMHVLGKPLANTSHLIIGIQSLVLNAFHLHHSI